MLDVPRVRATMRRWVGDKGFGFATPMSSGAPGALRRVVVREEDVFVHVRALCAHLREVHAPEPGAPVSPASLAWPDVYIEVESGDRGPRARTAVCAWCEAAPERSHFA